MTLSETHHPPADPVSAVTHADPYPYYRRLAAERPFHRDARLGLWVAASARAVTAVLTNPACRVRPPGEPVPTPIAGSPAGALFGRLVRMNDGVLHPSLKQAVVATLDAVDGARLKHLADRQAALLARGMAPSVDAAAITEFALAISTHALGRLFGFADDALPSLRQHVGDCVRCFAPACSAEQLVRGKAAAARLLGDCNALCRGADSSDEDTLLGALSRQMRQFGCGDRDLVVANGIGFLTQAYEAVAALISATILTLAREKLAVAPGRLPDVVDEVLRFDSPVQNTRRFVAEPTTIEGQDLRPGDVVLVLLAAANHDPAANPEPERFDPARRQRQVFSFGVGPHACPARRIATAIAASAVECLLENGVDPGQFDTESPYLPSVNIRFPVVGRRECDARKNRPEGGC